MTSQAPNYYSTRLGELKLQMLAEAAKDARSRAENILNSAGNTSVGKLVYADMGIININAANSAETSTEGNIAVGTAVAGGPPRRSVREELPHTALALSRARKRCSG